MTRIIFSKDRALQLEALLRSYAAHVRPRGIVDVLWAASSPAHVEAYQDVFDLYPWAAPHRQGASFKTDLLALLPATGVVIFFVDDLVFTRDWPGPFEPGWSLRLGLHLTRCYPIDQPQPIPPHAVVDGTVAWNWADGEGDWGYPWSLDAQTYDLATLRPRIAAATFRSPNTLEAQLHADAAPVGVGRCFVEARVVNVPWNRVQRDWPNRHGTDVYVSEADLLGAWRDRRRIALDAFDGLVNASCHQEFPLALEARP